MKIKQITQSQRLYKDNKGLRFFLNLRFVLGRTFSSFSSWRVIWLYTGRKLVRQYSDVRNVLGPIGYERYLNCDPFAYALHMWPVRYEITRYLVSNKWPHVYCQKMNTREWKSDIAIFLERQKMLLFNKAPFAPLLPLIKMWGFFVD